MGQNCKPYMVLRYLLSRLSSSNPNADILVTSLVLKPCAHALRQPRGSHLSLEGAHSQVFVYGDTQVLERIYYFEGCCLLRVVPR